jgi:hypothetical protein
MAESPRDVPEDRPDHVQPPQTDNVEESEPPLQDAEEWGTRLDHAKLIHRGGKSTGHVAGACPE